MDNKESERHSNYVSLYDDKSYLKNKIVILGTSIFFLMVRFGAIIPDLDNLSIKGFRVISLPRTIAALYLIWLYLYFSFYQKYWRIVQREIVKTKESVFKEKVASFILHETHEKLGHDFHWFEIDCISFHPIMNFFISYSPTTIEDGGVEMDHGRRSWVINLKLKRNRKYILRYVAEVYLRVPIVTEYLIPFLFPIVAGIVCIVGGWAGGSVTIIADFGLSNV